MTDSTNVNGSSEENPEALVEGQRVAQAGDMESSAPGAETSGGVATSDSGADSDASGESTASQTLDAQSEDEKDRADRHY